MNKDINELSISKMHSICNYSNMINIPLLYYLTNSKLYGLNFSLLLLKNGANIDTTYEFMKSLSKPNIRLLKLYNINITNKRQYCRAICSNYEKNEFSLFFKDYFGLRKQIGGLIVSYFNSFN